MINLLLSILAGVVVFLLALATRVVHPGLCGLFGLVAAIGAYILLARRSGKQLEAIMAVAQKEMMAKKPERAVEALQNAFRLARWQFGVASSLHANIGVLLYVQKKFDEAEPHLVKSGSTLLRLWQAQAMLAAIRFRQKKYDEMEKIFDAALKGNKQETLLYAVYAWCENARGEKKKAIEVLTKAVDENKSDEKLKTLLQRAQNDKRLKLDGWGEQWWQFWLETPPMMMNPQGNVFAGRQRFGRGGYRR
jgi:predicted Zn-dependent protease